MKKIKAPIESVVIRFDFSSELTAVDSATVTVASHGAGTDPDLSSFLIGPPQISGTDVLQRIGGGIHGMKYRVRCVGQKSGGDTILREDLVYVSNPTL